MDITFWYILKIYYDSSEGTILLADDCFSQLFPINVGVKQGGKLSSYLFGKLVDNLIKKCIFYTFFSETVQNREMTKCFQIRSTQKMGAI